MIFNQISLPPYGLSAWWLWPYCSLGSSPTQHCIAQLWPQLLLPRLKQFGLNSPSPEGDMLRNSCRTSWVFSLLANSEMDQPVLSKCNKVCVQKSLFDNSSTRTRTVGGMVRPSPLAVLRLTTTANFVAW